jgi:hypothetical protein
MESITEKIHRMQDLCDPNAPKHNASDEETKRIMLWIEEETGQKLLIGDIWVYNDPDSDNYNFGGLTQNGENSVQILSKIIEKGTLKRQLEPEYPPEIILSSD